MAKEFYTEKDIEDLFNRGIKSLRLTENVVLTGLAYEKARRLDFQLISGGANNPPSAPVRPYLSEPPRRSTPQEKPMTLMASPQPTPNPPNTAAIENRIRSAVIAKLGNQVDATLLDNIIHRVVKGIGLK